MTIYDNKNDRSKITSVDFDDKTGMAFVGVRHIGNRDEVKKLLADIGQEVVAETRINTLPFFVTRGINDKEELFTKLKTSEYDKFEPHTEPKKGLLGFLKKHGWTIRGGSSIAGQLMTLYSSFNTVSKKRANEGDLDTKWDSSTGVFATSNLIANFINIIFGGARQKDTHGLEHLSKLISEEVNLRLPENSEYKISAQDVYKVEYMNDKEKSDLKKDSGATGFIRRNSVWFGEVFLRTVGSVAMVLSPGDWKFSNWGNAIKSLFTQGPKAAWEIIKNKDTFTFWAGTGMVMGKILGLTAQTYNPKEPEPTTYLGELRKKVFWRASSVIEFFAQNAVAYDRFNNKRLVDKKTQTHTADWVAGTGNIILAEPPYLTRLVLPYGRMELDVPEVQARLIKALTQLPQNEVSTVAARITARMVEYMGDNAPSFSTLYGQVVEKLSKYENIQITSKDKSYEIEQTRIAEEAQQRIRNGERTQTSISGEAANSPVYDVNAKPELATIDGEVTKSFADKFAQSEKKSPEDHKSKREHQHHENLTDMVDTSRQNLGGAAVA